MALDPTMSEVCLKKSIKRFFVDKIYKDHNTYIDFDTSYKVPRMNGVEVDRWAAFHFGPPSVRGCLTTWAVMCYVFSRKDNEGTKLSEMRDMIQEVLTDLNSNNGMVTVPLYDKSWEVVGGMIPKIAGEGEPDKGKDGTHFKLISLNFTFGSK